MSKTQESAEQVLQAVGGPSNVAGLEHCSTRLRFSLVDDKAVDDAALKQIPGVIGVVKGPQTQVVVGTKVNDFYRAIEQLRGPGAKNEAAKQPFSWKRSGMVFMDFVVSIFVPIIPAIAGAGIFKSLLVLLDAVGWLSAESASYQVLVSFTDAVFYFLPLLVTYTTAKKLNTNIPLALAIVSLLVFPAFTGLVSQEGGIALFGMQVPVVAYNAQVFPPILTVLLLAFVEKWINRWTPGPIKVFFVPFMCFVIVSPIMIFLLGPLGYWIGSILTAAMLWLYATLGWVAVAILAGLLPFIISVGMHKAFIPPTIATLADYGKDSFYLVSSLAHNIAESGSSFAVAIRTKNKTLRGTAISAGVSAFFGITEPALYGVTLQNKRALVSVIGGAVTGGAYLGLTSVAGFVAVGPGAASVSMYVDASNPMNFVNALIGFAISFAVSFVLAMFLWNDADSATIRELNKDAGEDALAEPALTADEGAEVFAPIEGEVVPLSDVDDEVFSRGILGQGVAIKPTNGHVYAPVNGTVTKLARTKHAIIIETEDKLQVLVHFGLDTVGLKGAPFITHVTQGDTVTVGDLLMEADLDALDVAQADPTTPIVVLNGDVQVHPMLEAGPIQSGAPILFVAQKEKSDVVA